MEALRQQNEEHENNLKSSLLKLENSLRSEAEEAAALSATVASNKLREAIESERNRAKIENEATEKLAESKIRDLQEKLVSIESRYNKNCIIHLLLV